MKRSKRLLLKAERKLLLPLVKIFSRHKFDRAFYNLLRRGGTNIEGNPYFISDDVFLDDVDWSLITIEEDVTISKGVTILVHDFSPTKAIQRNEPTVKKAYIRRPVRICRGAFIGANTIILPGTEIGKNTIVGAGSVVKGKVPSNSVLAGNPARIVETLDEYYEKLKEYSSDVLYKES